MRPEVGIVEIFIPSERIKHHYVEIRDADRDHALVTLVEIVSPSNKRPGSDRAAYLRKQQEILDSPISLVEIDLLRSGDRLTGGLEPDEIIQRLQEQPDYVVAVSRSWRRGADFALQLFAFTVRETLPCIRIPLREGEMEVPLDLQYCLQEAYDAGPYRRGAVDYGEPPQPPLSERDAAWAAERLKLASGEAESPVGL